MGGDVRRRGRAVRLTNGIVAIVEPTSRRSQRDGRDGQLLELGPAVRLGEDALAERVRERVDRDPVVGVRGGAAEELPRSLGLPRERPLRASRSRTSAPRARARGAGDRETSSSSAGEIAACRARSRADADLERRANAVGRPDAGRDEAWPARYSGSASSRRPRRGSELAAKRVRESPARLGRAPAPSPPSAARRGRRWIVAACSPAVVRGARSGLDARSSPVAVARRPRRVSHRLGRIGPRRRSARAAAPAEREP